MIKKDKPATDKPVAKAKPVKEPKAQEPKVEEPKAEKPAAAPADDVATPAGTDQYGRQVYNVKCASCGKQAQVPFKPSGDRPVYCRDCYMQQRRGGMGQGSSRGPRR